MDQLFEFAIKNWPLVLALVIITGLLIRYELSDQMSGISLLSPQQAIQMINHEKAVLLDIRSEEEYQAAHLANARSFPQATIEERMTKLQKFKNKAVIIYCQNGQKAPQVGAKLKKANFEQVYALKGGIQAWKSDNLPLETASKKQG